MDIKQLALFGILIFVFMALVNFLTLLRGAKKAAQKPKIQRVRRLIGGDDAARACAESVVRDVMEKHPDEVVASRDAGHTVPALDEPLAEARAYFLGRVEHRHRTLFNDTVDKLILKRS